MHARHTASNRCDHTKYRRSQQMHRAYLALHFDFSEFPINQFLASAIMQFGVDLSPGLTRKKGLLRAGSFKASRRPGFCQESSFLFGELSLVLWKGLPT